MKHISAIIAALLITSIIGFGIFAIGANALANRNTVALKESPNSSVASSDPASNTAPNAGGGVDQNTQNQIQQLQQQLGDAQAQLDQANQQLQQYQALVDALQQRGVIRIDQNGVVHIPRGFGDGN